MLDLLKKSKETLRELTPPPPGSQSTPRSLKQKPKVNLLTVHYVSRDKPRIDTETLSVEWISPEVQRSRNFSPLRRFVDVFRRRWGFKLLLLPSAHDSRIRSMIHTIHLFSSWRISYRQIVGGKLPTCVITDLFFY